MRGGCDKLESRLPAPRRVVSMTLMNTVRSLRHGRKATFPVCVGEVRKKCKDEVAQLVEES